MDPDNTSRMHPKKRAMRITDSKRQLAKGIEERKAWLKALPFVDE